jgi:hypothetical protein
MRNGWISEALKDAVIAILVCSSPCISKYLVEVEQSRFSESELSQQDSSIRQHQSVTWSWIQLRKSGILRNCRKLRS